MGVRRSVRAAAMVALLACLTLLGGVPADAAAGATIDHVDAQGGTERVLFSIGGLPSTVAPDFSSVDLLVDGASVHATAAPASDRPGLIRRTAMLVIDSSDSMRGARFAAAKSAALAFIAKAPADVRIGLVSFAGTVSTVQAPTTDRAAVRAAVDSLRLSGQTHLYDGVRQALKAAGTSGQRRLLVLTDGNDTSATPLSFVVRAVRQSGDRVDAVGISVSPRGVRSLSQITAAGQGTLVNPADPSALKALFETEARALAQQILVSFPVPRADAHTSVDLVVRVAAGGQTYADDAYVRLGAAAPVVPHDAPTVSSPAPSSRTKPMPNAILYAGVVAIGLGILVAAFYLVGWLVEDKTSSPERRLSEYGGAAPAEEPTAGPSVRESAVSLASRALKGGGLEARLTEKLEAAGMHLKPAEWLLAHAGLALGAGLLGVLLTGGKLLVGFPMLVLGLVLPWLFLGRKETSRVRAFNTQLADSLQLVSGGLKAGLSLGQSLDTIVREGNEPTSSEFQRALVEASLGVEIEDALERVAQRMKSADFAWVVMAVRIQRQVGGNLGELLLTVAATLREREYLRRQVRSLSAEGRMSAYVLCGMPPLFLAYLGLTNRSMVTPLFTTGLGMGMLVVAGVMMGVGILWMSRVVKVKA